jgi:hypothetical protein
MTTTDTAPIHLERDVMGRLLLRGPDGMIAAVRPTRLFPLSCPEGYIALLDNDEQEIALVRDMGDLDFASRQALQEALEASYLVPEILAIYEVREEFGVLQWHVQTDRGERRFDVRGRDEIYPVGHGHFLVRDIEGVRYEIHSAAALDANSQVYLDLCL